MNNETYRRLAEAVREQERRVLADVRAWAESNEAPNPWSAGRDYVTGWEDNRRSLLAWLDEREKQKGATT